MNRKDKLGIIERVREHFIDGNNPFGFDGMKGCRYRTKGGACCAIGLLIPDELYTEGLEGNTALTLPEDVEEHLGIANEKDRQFFRELQQCHDTAASTMGMDYTEKQSRLGELLGELQERVEDGRFDNHDQ